MKIILDNKAIELNKNSSVFDVLKTANINPETVLVKKKNKLIPHDSLLEDGDHLETVTVISGG